MPRGAEKLSLKDVSLRYILERVTGTLCPLFKPNFCLASFLSH